MIGRAILLGCMVTAAAAADTLHVPSILYPTIQSAIDAAEDGDDVLVAPGTYYETIDFLGKSITVASSEGSDITAIDATEEKDTVVYFWNQEGPESVLDGFTLTGGIGYDHPTYGRHGGGMFIAYASPTVSNCVIEGNSAMFNGGGAYVDTGHPKFTQCVFRFNESNGTGGGIYLAVSNATLEDCTFANNAAVSGGGLYVYELPNTTTGITMEGCQVTANSSAGDAGGMFITQVGPATISGCSFTDNTTASNAGGVRAVGAAQFFDCIIAGNTASGVAGGVRTSGWRGFSASFTNCTIENNTSSSYGGGIQAWNECTAIFRDCWIVNNTGGSGGGADVNNVAVTFDSCIFQGNSVPGDGDGGAMLFHGGDVSGFVVDCVISGNQAARGAGITAFVGNPEIVNSIIYENTAEQQGGGVWMTLGTDVRFFNSILWGNNDASGNGESAQIARQNNKPQPQINHCIVQNWSGQLGGAGNRGDDPRWVDPDGADDLPGTPDDDFHLFPTSPCIDAGTNYIPTVNDFDFDGDPRFIDDPWTADTGKGSSPIIDIGPDEFVPATSSSPGYRIWFSGDGTFGDSGMWLPQDVPDTDDDAVLEVAGPARITLTTDRDVGSMHHTNGDVTIDLAGNTLTLLEPLRVGPYEGKNATLIVIDSTSPLRGGASLVAEDLYIGVSGTMIIDASVAMAVDSATLVNGATLGGNTTVEGDVSNLSGRIAPGFDDAQSVLEIEGAYNQASSGGSGLRGNCPAGEIPDCNGNCAPDWWLGDGICDDGSYTWNGIAIYFNCEEFACDNGDCGTWNGAECSGSGGGGDEYGACCADWGCVVVSEWECVQDIGGTYLGDGTDCLGDPCGTGAQGACCKGATCVVETEDWCLKVGGSYQGDGVSCDEDPCSGGGSEFGACCLGGGCQVLMEDQCIAKSGEFLGPWTNCDGDPCGTPMNTGGGTLSIDIAGRILGDTHDHLSVGGNAALGGGVQLDFDPDFTVYPNDTFDILNANSVSGTFGSLWTRGLPSHKAAHVSTSPGVGGGDVWVNDVDPIGFEQGMSIPLAAMPADMLVADMDYNGFPDIAVSMPSGSVIVHLNPGTGSAMIITTDVGANPMGMAIADLEIDGDLDLVVANHDDDSVSVLFFDTTSNTFNETAFAVGDGPSDVGIGDFIHTSMGPDFAVACTNANSVEVFGNQYTSNPPFTQVGSVYASSPSGIDPGDVGDTKDLDDYVITSTNTNDVYLRDGDGLGGVYGMLYTPVDVGSMPVAQAVADFDADGLDDVVTVNQVDDTWSLIRDGGNGSESFVLGGDPSDVVTGDIDGDGDPDVVFVAVDDGETETAGDRVIMVGRNDTEFAGIHTINRAGLVGAGTDPWLVDMGDIDGDGDVDLVAVTSGSGLRGSWAITIFDQVPVETPCTGDLNGSGSVDVADLLAVIAAWGQTGDVPEDLNGDGTVNVADLLQLIGLWGPCPG